MTAPCMHRPCVGRCWKPGTSLVTLRQQVSTVALWGQCTYTQHMQSISEQTNKKHKKNATTTAKQPPPKKKRSLNTLDDTRLIQIKKTGTHEDALSIHVDVHNPNRNMSICTEDAHSGLRYTADTWRWTRKISNDSTVRLRVIDRKSPGSQLLYNCGACCLGLEVG